MNYFLHINYFMKTIMKNRHQLKKLQIIKKNNSEFARQKDINKEIMISQKIKYC